MKRHTKPGFNELRPYYRPFCVYWWKQYLNPKTYYRSIKHFCQRGVYGYADCDYWSADDYLENVMLGVIGGLKQHAHGYPDSLADYRFDDIMPEGAIDTGFEKWIAILNEITEGLEASRELVYEETIPDGIYSDGPWHFEDCGDGTSKFIDESTHKFDKTAYEAWQAPLLIKRKRAMYLICKYWGSFWD